MKWKSICLHAITVLAALLFVAYGIFGCDQYKAGKDRVALLACVDHGGSKSYMPKGDHLEVVCKDGTLMSVKWLPSK